MVRLKGASGVIVRSPTQIGGDYRVRFADGVEITLASGELEVLKHYQNKALGDAQQIWDAYDFRPHVEYVCVVGSRAYGLEHDGSDLDLRGFYLAPP
ncbi:MAG: nucleotidyltransferase domain-containing protein, partial [Myxococcota bacterium]